MIVKVSFAPHRAGSGKLAAHAAYLGRDGAARDGEQGRFYSAGEDRVEELGQELGTWSREHPRHFRIIIAPESAARLDDLDTYVREVMARMERDLGTATDWVAVNHWNTDNPHAHVILRGRSQDGRELRIPRAYLSHGLRHQAREIATGLLGERGELDDRLALDRAARSRGLTSRDRTIAASLRGHSRTEFMRDAAVRTAEEVIMENTVIRMSPDGFAAFLELLDRPAQPVPEMVEVLQRQAPWETATDPQ